jgi:hypothetical protein
MLEAYKIGVAIHLADHVTRGLMIMSGGVLRNEKEVAQLQKRYSLAAEEAKKLHAQMKNIESIKSTALLGAGLMGVGAIGLKLLDGPLEKAKEYERQLLRMRQMGLGDAQIADAHKFANAQKIMGQSRLDMMRHFTEAQGAFRESGMDGLHALDAAKVMTPVLAQYEASSELLSGSTKAAAHQAMMNLNKTVEIMGGLNDPKRAAEIAGGVFKAVQSSGRMIDERQLKQFVAYGSSATNSMDMRAIFGGLEPIIGEFGGSTVATGLRTAFTRMSGAMALPPHKMQDYLKGLGIGTVDHGAVHMNDNMLKLMQTDAIGFAKKMQEVYAQHGITSSLDRERMNAQLFGTNGAKVYNKIMQQMEVLERSLLAYDRSMTPEQISNTPEGKRLLQFQEYHKKLEDLQLAFGQSGGLIDLVTKSLQHLNPILETFSNWARENPGVMKGVIGGFAGLSVLGVVTGSALLLKAAFGVLDMSLTALARSAGLAAAATEEQALANGVQSSAGKGGVLSNAARSIGLRGLGYVGAGIAMYEGMKYAADWANSQLAKGDTETLEMLDRVVQNHDFRAYQTGMPGLESQSDQHQKNYWKTGSQNIALPNKTQTIQVNSTVNLDGRKIGEAVTTHQTIQALKPQSGISVFDPTMGITPIGLGAQHG